MSNPEKVYLGDAVYAEYDGVQIKLTTNDGCASDLNTIYLEEEVFEKLCKFGKAQYNTVKETPR